MNIKKKKFRSKRGMTLVELVIGIAIVVIVFASTLGAMVGGYSTTVNNADENKVAAQNAATNEVIMRTLKSLQWESADDANDCLDALRAGNPASDDAAAAINAAATIYAADTHTYIGMQFVDSGSFPSDSVDYQYTLLEATSQVDGKDITGTVVKTAMKTSTSGFVINESFAPYQ
ncbi:MAG: prepilin-type N-terminal cleavage/methylation domain-containing protein [Clostridia bacterium]|nr:prepilin-type N-terminal cleavage/methylation domain-containing protein [Clostridia bacterium]